MNPAVGFPLIDGPQATIGIPVCSHRSVLLDWLKWHRRYAVCVHPSLLLVILRVIVVHLGELKINNEEIRMLFVSKSAYSMLKSRFPAAKVGKTFELAKCLARKSICGRLIWPCRQEVVPLRTLLKLRMKREERRIGN